MRTGQNYGENLHLHI